MTHLQQQQQQQQQAARTRQHETSFLQDEHEETCTTTITPSSSSSSFSLPTTTTTNNSNSNSNNNETTITTDTQKKISRKKKRWLQQQEAQRIQQEDDDKYWYTILMDVDKSKFFDPNYAVLEGDIQADVYTVMENSDNNSNSNSNQTKEEPVLKRGERVFVMCRRQVRRLHQTLVGESSHILEERMTNEKSKEKPFTTGWLRHELYGLQAAVRLPLGGGPCWNASYLSLNRRGIKCLDLPGEFVGLFDQDMIAAASQRQTSNRLESITATALLLSLQSPNDDDSSRLPPFFTVDKDDILTIQQSDLQERMTRHGHFADWLIETFGLERLNSGSGVLDVAGGNGKLSATLVEKGVTACTILDPQPLVPSRDGILVLPEPLQGDGSALTLDDYPNSDRIRNCSIIVGLHPDQATEAVVDMALRLGKPFAVSPCCTMSKLFPNRKYRKTGDPVRTVWALCRYLLDKAPATSPFQVDFLPFAGRNKVIYWHGIGEHTSYCQEVAK